MSERDALGRCRRPTQSRGLRPLYPLLPRGVRSRSIRVAMTAGAWARLEEHVAVVQSPTAPRAVGELLELALGSWGWAAGGARNVAGWQEWQIRKEQRLLARLSRSEAAAS